MEREEDIPFEETIVYDDGSKYMGELINGKRNGKGTLFFNDGSSINGEWKDDELVDDNATNPSPQKSKITLGLITIVVGLLIFLSAILHIPSYLWGFGAPVLQLYVFDGFTFDGDMNLIKKTTKYDGSPSTKELQKRLLGEYPSLFDNIEPYEKIYSDKNEYLTITRFLASNELSDLAIDVVAFEVKTTGPTYGIALSICIIVAGLAVIGVGIYRKRSR